jgi:hypothetical protein
MRYLWHAFFARPDIPLLRLPWNAIGIIGAAVAGFWDPAIWGVATAGELIYLFTLASNSGFQQSIDYRRIQEQRGDTDDARYALKKSIGGAARRRYEKLEEKRTRLEKLSEQHKSDDLFYESNRDALRKLTWLFLNLLVAQRNLVIAPESDERDLQKQIAAVERELAAATSDSLRGSKQATLRLLRARLDNVQHRQTSLAEVEADLARIETQFDVALEEASMRGAPTAISANVELTSHLLANMDEEPTTYTPPRELQ